MTDHSCFKSTRVRPDITYGIERNNRRHTNRSRVTKTNFMNLYY